MRSTAPSRPLPCRARVETSSRRAALLGIAVVLLIGNAAVSSGASVAAARGVNPGAQYEGKGVALIRRTRRRERGRRSS